jgi:hypothetical protein
VKKAESYTLMKGNVKTFQKIIWQYVKKLNLYLPSDSVILPPEMKTIYTKTYTQMFMED